MSRCPNCDTPLHITRAASPVIESDGAHEYRMNAINSALPKLSEPEKVEAGAAKVFEFIDGDVVTINALNKYWHIYRHNKCYGFPELVELYTARRSVHEVDRGVTEIEAHLATLGYVAKWPTPASDSVEGEVDRHGRTIVNREGHAMVVNCGTSTLPFLVVDTTANYWFYCGEKWCEEKAPDECGNYDTEEEALAHLLKAAATPLPTANPAASAKETYTSFASDFLELDRAIAELNRRITALEARQ